MGYEVEGNFSEDYDGVAKFADAVAQEIAKEQLDTVFSQFPDVEQYLQYRYNGGDPKQYFQATAPVVDYSAVEITDENVAINVRLWKSSCNVVVIPTKKLQKLCRTT